MPAIEGGGGAASIEGADAPGARCASQARGVPAIEGLLPYEDWLRQCFYPLPSIPQTKNEPPMRGSLILPEFVLKTKGSRFGVMILDEERV